MLFYVDMSDLRLFFLQEQPLGTDSCLSNRLNIYRRASAPRFLLALACPLGSCVQSGSVRQLVYFFPCPYELYCTMQTRMGLDIGGVPLTRKLIPKLLPKLLHAADVGVALARGMRRKKIRNNPYLTGAVCCYTARAAGNLYWTDVHVP